MAGVFVINKAKDGQFWFDLKAGNGRIILTSERYPAKNSALVGIASVKTNAHLDDRYERKVNRKGEPMFNLKAANGRVIGTSEGYSSVAARENGIDSVKTNASSATVNDLTI